MPLYEYQAVDNGERIEMLYPNYESAPVEFEEGDRKFVRIISSPAFFFDGPFSGSSKNVKHKETRATYDEVTKHTRRRRAYQAEDRDKALDKALEQTASEMTV